MNGLLPRRDVPIDYLMALRGAAVIGVLLGHLFGIGGLSIGTIVSKGTTSYVFHGEYYEPWRSALEIATPLIGLNFVIMFFVLSGYLMGKVFFEGRYDPVNGKRAFYWARYLRLAPLLYFNLLMCIALVPFADLSPLMMAGDFLFLNNFTGRGINLVTWSLSHEMQYYLLAPFIFLLFRGRGPFALPGALGLTVAAFILGRYFAPLGFVSSFLAGFSVNLLKLPAISLSMKRFGVVLGLLLLHFGFNALFFFHYEWQSIFEALLVSAGLVAVCEMPLRAPEAHAPLVWRLAVLTGFLTYGIYLWHYVIIRTQSPRLLDWIWNTKLADWLKVVIYQSVGLIVVVVLSYAIAYITFELIEKRFRPGLYSKL